MWRHNLFSELFFEKKLHDRVAKYLTGYFGNIWFLYGLVTFILLWIILNFDPFPYIFLMILLQFFTVLLSVIVLISQNRESNIADIRQQVEFEVNVRAENEITKILQMVKELHTKLGIEKYDREFEAMKEKINIEEIKEIVETVMSGDIL